MKRYLRLFLILALLGVSFAPLQASDEQSIETYTVVNTGATSASTAVSTSTIIPGKSRILGFDVAPTVSGSGTTAVALHDAASVATTSSTTWFGELVGANTASYEKWYPAPKSLASGLVILQGPGTVVTVYYEKTIP